MSDKPGVPAPESERAERERLAQMCDVRAQGLEGCDDNTTYAEAQKWRRVAALLREARPPNLATGSRSMSSAPMTNMQKIEAEPPEGELPERGAEELADALGQVLDLLPWDQWPYKNGAVVVEARETLRRYYVARDDKALGVRPPESGRESGEGQPPKPSDECDYCGNASCRGAQLFVRTICAECGEKLVFQTAAQPDTGLPRLPDADRKAVYAAGAARGLTRMETVAIHDYPALAAFHDKHALGSKSAPSCLVCGKVTKDAPAIQHMELPDIVVCFPCRDAALGTGLPRLTAEDLRVALGDECSPVWPAYHEELARILNARLAERSGSSTSREKESK